jgi:hypothetical protein
MMTTVRDVMSTDLVTVEPSTMMIDAAAAMSSARVGSVSSGRWCKIRPSSSRGGDSSLGCPPPIGLRGPNQ